MRRADEGRLQVVLISFVVGDTAAGDGDVVDHVVALAVVVVAAVVAAAAVLLSWGCSPRTTPAPR